MRIEPGPREEDKEIELGKTEARQAWPGYNIYMLVFGMAGVMTAFILLFLLQVNVRPTCRVGRACRRLRNLTAAPCVPPRVRKPAWAQFGRGEYA